MARKEADGTKHKKSDKARERFDRNGKYSTKHIRITEQLKAKTNMTQLTRNK